jgi:hypothetical protein
MPVTKVSFSRSVSILLKIKQIMPSSVSPVMRTLCTGASSSQILEDAGSERRMELSGRGCVLPVAATE